MPRAVSWLEVRGPTLPLQIYSARRALLLNYYTKSELAYPCGNDANTGRCCRYNSNLPLEKKIVRRHSPGTMGVRNLIRQFCVDLYQKIDTYILRGPVPKN